MAHLLNLGGGFVKSLCSSFPFETMTVASKLSATLIYVLVYGFLSMDVPLIEKRVCAAMR
jgi:hypothetical protein